VTRCDRIRNDAAGLAALPAGDPEREEAWAHARECQACARALDEAERLQAMVAAMPAPPRGGADALAGASRAIVSELRREARWRMLASAIAVCAAFVLSLGLARHRSPFARDWALALALAVGGMAAAVGAASRRWALLIVGAAAAAALGIALCGTGFVLTRLALIQRRVLGSS
jgi:hypothetical protein